jgi:hypothetical protein
MSDLDQGILDIIKGHAVGLAAAPTRDTLITDLGIDSFAVVEITMRSKRSSASKSHSTPMKIRWRTKRRSATSSTS